MPDSASTSTYSVMADDNFHYMDEDERYLLGIFASFETALAACRAVVERFLDGAFEPGMSADQLVERYKQFGEDPFIRGPAGVTPPGHFSGWTYAREHAERLCGSAPAPSS